MRSFPSQKSSINQMPWIRRAIECSELGKEAALMLIAQAITCIMHLKNHSGENFLTMLLSIGAGLHQSRRILANLSSYVAEVEHIASRVILGLQWRPKQWEVPVKENGEELARILLSNTKTQAFMTLMDPLMTLYFSVLMILAFTMIGGS